MGALDIKAKKYLGKKDAFADAFNYLIYDGEPVIDPDSLRDMDTSHIALPYGNNASLPIQKYRDLLRIWDAKTDGNMIYLEKRFKEKYTTQCRLKTDYMTG